MPIHAHPGDSFIFFSDGIIDAVNREGVKSQWYYTTMFDGKFRPVTGQPGSETAVEVINDKALALPPLDPLVRGAAVLPAFGAGFLAMAFNTLADASRPASPSSTRR